MGLILIPQAEISFSDAQDREIQTISKDFLSQQLKIEAVIIFCFSVCEYNFQAPKLYMITQNIL